jgi:hypothetical protein
LCLAVEARVIVVVVVLCVVAVPNAAGVGYVNDYDAHPSFDPRSPIACAVHSDS